MSKDLNEKLYRAITAEKTNYIQIEDLLRQGADPLGALNDECETPLQRMFCDAPWLDTDGGRLPKIMQLFLDCGFDCSRIQPSDDEDHNLDMWCLTFAISEGACAMLKIMLDNGLQAMPLNDFIEHFYFDAELIDDDLCEGEVPDDYIDYLKWAMKMVMLSASYPHILSNNEYLQHCIELDATNKDNQYPLEKFRDYDNYEVHLDFSTMKLVLDGVCNTTVEISEKSTGNVVWRMKI